MAPAVDADHLARRSPFSANPAVGPRGQRTQQRILDAALAVFGDEGFHGASIERITNRAGCSRATFYQYFAGKDEVFGQLAAQVARQVVGATDALDQLTSDEVGRAALSSWVGRYAEIYQRSTAVFRVFDVAEGAAGVVAARATAGEHAVSRIRSKLDVGGLPQRELDAVITLLVDCVGRTLHIAELMRAAAPDAYPRDRINDALTNVMHRTLFGRVAAVNDGTPGPSTPPLPFSPAMQDVLPAAVAHRVGAKADTLSTLLTAGREVLAERGYHATRVDDIVSAAGLSHGAFYRYFANVSDFAQAMVREAMQPVSAALAQIPAADSGVVVAADLRAWLRRYNDAQSHHAAMITVWIDASSHDPDLAAVSAPALDWGRRQMERFLLPRGFGDVAAEAIVMLALLDAFGVHERSTNVIDSVAHVVARGLLGQPT